MSEVERLAVVGCGAAAEIHLTVLSRLPVEVACLVDRDPARSAALAAKYGVDRTLEDYRDLAGAVDGAVLSLPHHLHAPAAVDLLSAGLHVLVEKPMAMTAEECDRMIAAAAEARRVLAVGMARRFYDAGSFVKSVIDRGSLGRIRSVDVREGYVYDWPVASEFMFRRDSGGGVLADAGAHILDNLLWWLRDFDNVAYRDDARGGVAADCEVVIEMRSGARCHVELSRTRRLRNTWIIEGTEAELEIDTAFNPVLRWGFADGVERLEGRVRAPGAPQEEALDCFRRQMEDFLAAAEHGRAPRVPGSEGRRFVELLEACEASRQPLEFPWS